MSTLSMDIGATNTRIALINSQGKIIKKQKSQTPAKKNASDFSESLIFLIKKFLGDEKINKITIAFAGSIDLKQGSPTSQPDLKKNLKNSFKVPVTIENDANCFVLAESVLGAGKNYNSILGITIGSGIGGGIVINDELLTGANNLAGEIGHIIIDDKNTRWEQIASGNAWQKISKKSNDKNADEIIAKNLALGIANLLTTIDPEIIILGGGLTDRANLLKLIKQNLPKCLFYKKLAKTKIVKTKLGDDAGLIGAYLLTEDNT